MRAMSRSDPAQRLHGSDCMHAFVGWHISWFTVYCVLLLLFVG